MQKRKRKNWVNYKISYGNEERVKYEIVMERSLGISKNVEWK